MQISATALCSLEDVKDYLQVEHARQEGVLIELINEVSADCERFCRRQFLKRTYTAEKYDGDGTDTLLLEQYPVATLTELKRYTGAVAEVAANYTLYSEYGKIVLTYGGIFPVSQREVSVTYDAGHDGLANLPMDLRMAVVRAVAYKYREFDQQRLGLTSMTQGEQTQTFSSDRYPKAVIEIWRRHLRHQITRYR